MYIKIITQEFAVVNKKFKKIIENLRRLKTPKMLNPLRLFPVRVFFCGGSGCI